MDSENTLPQAPNPIVLTPGNQAQKQISLKEDRRGFLSTLGVLFSGWLMGNLILLTLLSVVGIYLAGSSGLVRVPVLSDFLFGKPPSISSESDTSALQSAESKIAQINSLKKGETIKTLSLEESEVNALFQNKVKGSSDFPITDPKLKLNSSEFTFTGKLAQTNAPVTIEGKIAIDGLVANIEIVSAKFGKFVLPNFIANNIIENNLSKIGLSLSGSQIPAKSLKINSGTVNLEDVSNPKEN